MDELKGFAEVAKHILYEAFGLLVPGGTCGLLVAAALGPHAWTGALAFAGAHPWLALAGCYVLGYPVQSLSRPVTTLFERLLQSPTRLLERLGRALPERARRPVRALVGRAERALTRRHAHDHASRMGDRPTQATPDGVDPPGVALEELMREHWHRRLGLGDGRRLTAQQAKDLSFSALLAERERLDRFRAATSLARGVAFTTAIIAVIMAVRIMARLTSDLANVTWQRIGVMELLLVAFYGFMERADMYDRLWHAVVPAQFLCAATRDGVGAPQFPAGTGSPAHSSPAPHTGAPSAGAKHGRNE